MAIGARLKQLREKLGISAYELAKRSGVSQPTVSRIENNQIDNLQYDTAINLAKALGVTPEYLLGKTDKITEEEKIDAKPEYKFMFRNMEKLSPEQRKQVLDYVQFLSKQEREKQRKKKKDDK